MTLSIAQELAQALREDNPEASGAMSATDRAAAKAIHALADALDKVSIQETRAEESFQRRFVAMWDENTGVITCDICLAVGRSLPVGSAPSLERGKLVVLEHYRTTHPRAYPAAKKALEK